MPGGNGTGPGGMGSMTGRGAGYCAGNTTPGYANAAAGGGFGFSGGRGLGRGGGLGRRNMFNATGLAGWQRSGMNYNGYGTNPVEMPYGQTMTQKQELDMLKGQSENIEGTLEGIKKRIGELEAEKS